MASNRTPNSSSTRPRSRPRSASAQFSRTVRFTYESPQRLKDLERGFVLDGVALSKHANDEIGRTQPSLNIAIPQYNAMQDPHCKSYFKMRGLPKANEKRSEQGSDDNNDLPSTMMGTVFDKFVRSSSAKQYLEQRESLGAGYTRKIYGGHLTVPTAPPKVGYHGPEGYRRNTPDLRAKRSVFDDEDPFDNPQPINLRPRTRSAPATVRLLRLKSARVYQQPPRALSALPRPTQFTSTFVRPLATGPID